MDEIHDRMPVVLEPRRRGRLARRRRAHEPAERQALLVPAPAGTLVHHGVDQAVGSVRNDGPELIAPAEPAARSSSPRKAENPE